MATSTPLATPSPHRCTRTAFAVSFLAAFRAGGTVLAMVAARLMPTRMAIDVHGIENAAPASAKNASQAA